jgi:hypothetical protein
MKTETIVAYVIAIVIGIVALVIGITSKSAGFVGFGAGTLISSVYLIIRRASGRPSGAGAIFEGLGWIDLLIIVVAYVASFVVASLVVK